jgi:predicted AAA+ superfamily ATPase
MIKRDYYLERLWPYVGNPQVKLVTGLRRRGKTTLFRLLADEIKGSGVDEAHIIHLDFDNPAFCAIQTAGELRKYVEEKTAGAGTFYLFLDEIQEISGWEKVASEWVSNKHIDIYIASSNISLLSGKEAMFLDEKYIEIAFKPLSFGEYHEMNKQNIPKTGGLLNYMAAINEAEKNNFEKYLREGGIISSNTLKDIYTTILLRDIVSVHRVKNIAVLERIIAYIFNNIGKRITARDITEHLKTIAYKVEAGSVYRILGILEDAFLINRVPRYDILKDRESPGGNTFYVSDHSFISKFTETKDMLQCMLRNILAQDLERRGFTVYTGKLKNAEIDFAAFNQKQRVYIQTVEKLDGSPEVTAKIDALLAIEDNHPKYVVSMENQRETLPSGIHFKSAAQFLLTP